MVINPTGNTTILCKVFPHIMINDQSVEFVKEFIYVGHVLSLKMRNDSDIKREIRNMFMRTSMLIQMFKRCSVDVKTRSMRQSPT